MKSTKDNLYNRYWELALDRIHKKHDKCFRKVKSTNGTLKNGYFRINGFSLGCSFNQESATVGLYLSKPKKEKVTNKAAFDHLYSHKDEIENDLGAALNWHRNSNEVSSKVTIILDNVSINNKEDWDKIADFHAEWSKKFYDVIVPYLVQFMN